MRPSSPRSSRISSTTARVFTFELASGFVGRRKATSWRSSDVHLAERRRGPRATPAWRGAAPEWRRRRGCGARRRGDVGHDAHLAQRCRDGENEEDARVARCRCSCSAIPGKYHDVVQRDQRGMPRNGRYAWPFPMLPLFIVETGKLTAPRRRSTGVRSGPADSAESARPIAGAGTRLSLSLAQCHAFHAYRAGEGADGKCFGAPP